MRLTAPLICPRVHAPADTMVGTPHAEGLSGRHILIAEDEGLLALDMEFALIDAGATVLGPIIQVDEGLALLAAEHLIDAAILDFDLRGQSAYPIADVLVQRGIPFVFYTGRGRQDDLRARYGDDTLVFTKPSRIEGVIASLVKLIADRC